MMTMTVALGTSTPTSITVVDINTSISPAENADMVESFTSLESRPCKGATRKPEKGPL
ncbi:unannotated protein [freshwater metagenome]|uniref:Unannotated protein n=1 Tax=freshwater metagenome TaxID=449393 RepID=A0A6J7RQ57_9ZZZZ